MTKKLNNDQEIFSSKEIIDRIFNLAEPYLYGDIHSKFLLSMPAENEEFSYVSKIEKLKNELVNNRDELDKLMGKRFFEIFPCGMKYVVPMTNFVRHHAFRDPLVVDFISACIRFIEIPQADFDIKKLAQDAIKDIFKNITPSLKKNKTIKISPKTIAIEYREIVKQSGNFKVMPQKSRMALVKRFLSKSTEQDVIKYMLIGAKNSINNLALDILAEKYGLERDSIRDLLTEGNAQLKKEVFARAMAKKVIEVHSKR